MRSLLVTELPVRGIFPCRVGFGRLEAVPGPSAPVVAYFRQSPRVRKTALAPEMTGVGAAPPARIGARCRRIADSGRPSAGSLAGPRESSRRGPGKATSPYGGSEREFWAPAAG